MLKFLLILFAVMYITFKIGSYIVRILLGGAGPTRQGQSFREKPKDGNVNIDYDPKGKQNKKGYDGGEYVDYEEVD